VSVARYEPAGIRRQQLVEWLRTRVGKLTDPVHFEPILGGKSNLTFRIRDASGQRWVLRRPPLSGVLASAHDMHREYRVLTALRGSGVPVPRTIGHEPDTSVTGAEFYVMDEVDGHVLRTTEDASGILDAPSRHNMSVTVAETLAELHSIEPESVRLGDFGRDGGYVERQLSRWRRQLEKGSSDPPNGLIRLHEELVGRVPRQLETTIVHGDYRLDNLIVDSAGDVRAVLDWELSTLGTPLADVGMLWMYWAGPGDTPLPLIDVASTLDGFLNRAQLLDAYTSASGRDLSAIEFFIAFGAWKLAIIAEGVRIRSMDGAYSDIGDARVSEYRELVDHLTGVAFSTARGLVI
jgi:aminoglycoside phosphotransferase (APT) family kinase protein